MVGMQGKEIIIDGKNHISGRLAAVVAKQALEGKKIVIVRAEEIVISGGQYRNRLKYMEFLRKHANSNPTKRSHIHYREPSKMFKRIIRGMIPHKTRRGADALNRIRVFEGVPENYDKKKRLYVAPALKHLCLSQNMPTTTIGRLASSVGWKQAEVVQKLETVRKAKSAERFERRKQRMAEFRAKRNEIIKNSSAEVRENLLLI